MFETFGDTFVSPSAWKVMETDFTSRPGVALTATSPPANCGPTGPVGACSNICAASMGWEWLVLHPEKVSPEPEMVQDWMAITQCFSSRLDGLGNYRRAWKEGLR